MFHRIHFISALPDSGAELLIALLRQNPCFRVDTSSPLNGLFGALLEEMNTHRAFPEFIDDKPCQRILRGLFDQYYAGTQADVVFDSSLTWRARLPALARLFPDSRIIACLREMPRDALQVALRGEHADRLLLVPYDLLMSEPANALSTVYGFIDEPPFTHDLEYACGNIFDAGTGTSVPHAAHPREGSGERASTGLLDAFRNIASDVSRRSPGRIRRDANVA